MAMGQEVSATLLQMMLPYAAVANGGVLVSPRIVGKVIDPHGNIIDSGAYAPVRRVLSETVAARLRLMLRDVVENGTGKKAAVPGVAVAGKTGTSQKPDSGSYSRTRSWSSFIGFAPVNAPLLVCGIVIDEPAGGEMGGEAAAPVFNEILMQILSHPELEFAEKMLQKSPAPATVVRNGNPEQPEASLPDTVKREAIGDGVPLCIGKDLRDAVNLVNSRGFRPVAVGYGRVSRQMPEAGAKVTPAAACTLYCAMEGY
jgi:membrane peptidoglycan carboxypeptidase